MIKKYDIVATVGTYKSNGETKNRYKNVGVVMEKDGKPFILLEKTFNPAGLPGDKESVLLSLFIPKEKKEEKKEEYNIDDEIPY